MTFLTLFALGIAALVVAPYLAHRLRRQRATEFPFAPARLVPKTPPKARRRSRLEDRSLFMIRAASIVALALLGASPLVRCSHLALSRGGASVAIALVIDDSMSMRAKGASGRSRFARAKKGADEILASLREGDAAAIVLAGAEARVGLAATTDIAAARAALEGVSESDRATDLEGAITIARTLVGQLPQIDRRVVVLSDLADGKSDAPPLGEAADTTSAVWLAMPELSKETAASDCAILSADRTGGRARVRFACSTSGAAAGREVQLKDGDEVIAATPLPESALGEVLVPLAGDDARELYAVLSGSDAIPADDRGFLVVESGPAALAVVGDRTADDVVSTGGAPLVEQALAALHVDMAVRPLPQAPDRREDTVPFAAMIVDDPPGFTPEQRHALSAFVDRGGVLVLALGRRAASAPLGATFEPFLARPLSFGEAPSGADSTSGAPVLGEAAVSLRDLEARGRVTVAQEDAMTFEPLLKWSDGAPLVLRRTRGRGEVWLTTLPFSVDASDLPLRPGFLSILDAIVVDAKEHSAPVRGEVGLPWTFTGASHIEVEGPGGRVAVTRRDGALRVVPTLIGAYRFIVDGSKELRVAAPARREIDFRPRAIVPGATSSSLGGGVSVVDVSWMIALALLGLVAAEIVVRALTRPRGEVA